MSIKLQSLRSHCLSQITHLPSNYTLLLNNIPNHLVKDILECLSPELLERTLRLNKSIPNIEQLSETAWRRIIISKWHEGRDIPLDLEPNMTYYAYYKQKIQQSKEINFFPVVKKEKTNKNEGRIFNEDIMHRRDICSRRNSYMNLTPGARKFFIKCDKVIKGTK